MTIPARYTHMSPEVQDALNRGLPVVGLETTILAFGLPRPVNAEVAAECENAVRRAGAVPATVGILGGRLCAGLSSDEIGYFCSGDPSIRKVNLQGIGAALAGGYPGALTVAASVSACAACGIRVLATGGIGGVHRGYALTPDISSDLAALAGEPVAVVCSGAKSVLDLPATLEMLETLGVPVAGVGCAEFPAFYSRSSGLPLELRFDDMAMAARLVAIQLEATRRGIVIAVPCPEPCAIPRAEAEAWIGAALDLARQAGVVGKALTPFLLEHIARASGGRALAANRALVAANAHAAGQLAAELARICPGEESA